MFDQLVESNVNRKKSDRWIYFTVTAVLWISFLTGVIVWGIMAFDAKLNEQFEQLAKLTAPPPPAAPPPAAAQPKQVQPKTPAKIEAFVSAKEPPKEIKAPSPTPPQPIQNIGPVGPQGGGEGPPGGTGGIPGGLGSVAGGGEVGPPPPPPPPPPDKPKPEPPKIVRKSGGVLQGSATRRVQPSYPPLAKAARVSGAVVVEVTVDENGSVISARAISGHPLLKDAAVQAAQGWKFTPTQLSGVPVKVIGTITFNFTL